MPEDLSKLSFVDPDCVSETLCLGPFHVLPGELSTITFTHGRPKTAPLLAENRTDAECVVRARIVMSAAGLVALRNLLNRLLPVTVTREEGPQAIPPAGGSASIH